MQVNVLVHAGLCAKTKQKFCTTEHEFISVRIFVWKQTDREYTLEFGVKNKDRHSLQYSFKSRQKGEFKEGERQRKTTGEGDKEW